MSMNDPIADFLTRLRNAGVAKHASCDVGHSKVKEQLARILAQEGYIGEWSVAGEPPRKTITMRLMYDATGRAVIRGIERVSKPGRRQYSAAVDLPKVLNGMGVSVVSTSRGMMTDASARSQNVGGEVICNVW